MSESDQSSRSKLIDLRGSWRQAVLSLLLPILIVFGIRWIVLEPFVIPSGSMLPNLLIHDHVFVKKWKYGIKLPFLDRWLIRWSQPQRGEIVVFKYPENPNTYFIKRLVGKPGDHILIVNEEVFVNGTKLNRTMAEDQSFEGEIMHRYLEEGADLGRYLVQYEVRQDRAERQEIFVPPGNYFFMGDNRDHSNDSRFWGFVKSDYLVGPAWFIWLSCHQMLESQPHVCDPSSLRLGRIGTML